MDHEPLRRHRSYRFGPCDGVVDEQHWCAKWKAPMRNADPPVVFSFSIDQFSALQSVLLTHAQCVYGFFFSPLKIASMMS